MDLLDTTLRDGAKMAGIAYTKEEQVLIAKKLDEIGVASIEYMLYTEPETLKAIRDLNLNAKLVSLTSIGSKDWKEDIDFIIDAGIDVVSMSHPHPGSVFSPFFPGQMTEDWWINRLVEATEYVKSRGMPCVASAVDATRTDLGAVRKFCKTAVEAGVDRVKICDTMGVCGPASFRYLISEVKKEIGKTPVQLHIHNDFGCGIANVFASIEAGAEAIDVTVNGLGEGGGGNPSLGIVAVALRVLYGIETGIKLERLREISYIVEDLSRVPIPLNEPFVGRRYFHCTFYESMVAGLEKGDPFVASAILPDVVGMRRHILPGRLTSPLAIRDRLKELGIEVSREKLSIIAKKVHEESSYRKRALNDDDMLRIVKDVL